jgi:hypothetical protein
MAIPPCAFAHRLNDENLFEVFLNGPDFNWSSCTVLSPHRVDCERAYADDEAGSSGFDPSSRAARVDASCDHDLIAFFLNGAELDWRFYKDPCSATVQIRPRWATRLKPVPWQMLYSQSATGLTSQGIPISVGLVRSYTDTGRFRSFDLGRTVTTVRVTCTDRRTRRIPYDLWLDTSRRGRAVRGSLYDGDSGSQLTLRGRVAGHAWTQLNATLQVSQTRAHGVRCHSGPVRFTATSPLLDLF